MTTLGPHEIAAALLTTVVSIAAVYLALRVTETTIHLSIKGGNDYGMDRTKNGLESRRRD